MGLAFARVSLASASKPIQPIFAICSTRTARHGNFWIDLSAPNGKEEKQKAESEFSFAFRFF
jgi:hypothetical protein